VAVSPVVMQVAGDRGGEVRDRDLKNLRHLRIK